MIPKVYLLDFFASNPEERGEARMQGILQDSRTQLKVMKTGKSREGTLGRGGCSEEHQGATTVSYTVQTLTGSSVKRGKNQLFETLREMGKFIIQRGLHTGWHSISEGDALISSDSCWQMHPEVFRHEISGQLKSAFK